MHSHCGSLWLLLSGVRGWRESCESFWAGRSIFSSWAEYILVMLMTPFAPGTIIGVAYDSGGVTTSTITVPLTTALASQLGQDRTTILALQSVGGCAWGTWWRFITSSLSAQCSA